MTQVAPAYQHDCEACTHLGTIWLTPHWRPLDNHGQWVDLYVHENRRDLSKSTLIARTSDDGPDYHSTWLSMTEHYEPDHPLAIAYHLALRHLETINVEASA